MQLDYSDPPELVRKKITVINLFREGTGDLQGLVDEWDRLSTWASAGLGAAAFLILPHAKDIKLSVFASCFLILGIGVGAFGKLVAIFSKRLDYAVQMYARREPEIAQEQMQAGRTPEEADAYVVECRVMLLNEMQPHIPWWIKWLPRILTPKLPPTDFLVREKSALVISQWVALAVLCQYLLAIIAAVILVIGYKFF